MGKGGSFPILTSSLGKALLGNTRKVSGTWLVPSIQSGRPVLFVWDIQNLSRLRGGSARPADFYQRIPAALGLRSLGWLPCPIALPDRCDPLYNNGLLLAYTPGAETSLSPACQTSEGHCPDPPPQRRTPELLSTGPWWRCGRGPG